MITTANSSACPSGRLRSRRALAIAIRPAAILPAALAAIAAGGLWLAATAAAAPPPHNGKVTLCHARPPATAKNGWVQITVSTNAVTHEGHGKHADDIIPSFTYYVKGAQQTYPGKNLSTIFGGSTGAQILANGCALPAAAVPAPAATTPSPVVTKTVAAPAPQPVVVTTTVAAPITSTHTVVAHVSGAMTTRTVTSSASASKVKLVAVQSAGVDAVQATASPSPLADSVGVAAGDTGDRGMGSGDYVALYAAIGGAALAALLGIGGVALWRRHNDVGARL